MDMSSRVGATAGPEAGYELSTHAPRLRDGPREKARSRQGPGKQAAGIEELLLSVIVVIVVVVVGLIIAEHLISYLASMASGIARAG
jgi:hypothetical protein